MVIAFFSVACVISLAWASHKGQLWHQKICWVCHRRIKKGEEYGRSDIVFGTDEALREFLPEGQRRTCFGGRGSIHEVCFLEWSKEKRGKQLSQMDRRVDDA